MATITKQALERALTTHLHLNKPLFKLEKLPDGKLSGSIVSDSFVGMPDSERQRTIWDALSEAFGADCATRVGTLLAYTRAEWEVDLEVEHKSQ